MNYFITFARTPKAHGFDTPRVGEAAHAGRAAHRSRAMFDDAPMSITHHRCIIEIDADVIQIC